MSDARNGISAIEMAEIDPDAIIEESYNEDGEFVCREIIGEEKEELLAERAEYAKTVYRDYRQQAYPSIEDVTVALAEKAEGNSAMWDEITAQRQAVKDTHPKPE